MNTPHKTFIASCLFILMSSSALAQSSGVKWQNGNVLTAQQLQQLDNAKMNISSLGKPGFAPKLNAQGQITDPVVGSVANAPANAAGDTVSSIADTAKSAQITANGAVQANGGDATQTVVTATGSSISNTLADTFPLLSNLRTYTNGNGSNADATLMDAFVAAHCNEAVNVPAGYILPTNADGGAHFPDTSTCSQHYTWIYNSHPHTTGGTETDFRTPDDLHINYQNGMMSLSKTKINTATTDPQMLYLQFINSNQTVGPVSSNDTTRQSLKAVELNMQATAGSTGSLNGFQCDMTDNSTTGDNANVCAPSNVFKYSGVGKDWAISLAGYDYSATQPANTISYTGIENDLQVSGQDMGASLWDPTQGGRHLMWLGANTVQYPAWQASHAYSVGDKIVDSAKNWVWIVTTAGTSSTGSDPTGSWNPANGSYTDGTVVFTAKIDYHGVVSKAIYVINDHVDSDYSFYDDVLGVNANVRDASINLTNEILTNAGGASIRLASGHPIDFSGDGTQAGKNLHTLLYSLDQGRLQYRVKNNTVFSVDDGGSAYSASSLHMGQFLYLGAMSRAAVLAVASPTEGQKIYDTDDHEEVTYRCPTTSTCGWFPVQYGAALSN